MAADVLTTKFQNSLKITTTPKKSDDEDVAILSSFLPPSLTGNKPQNFTCHLGKSCRLGDPKLAKPGIQRLVFI